MVQLFEMLDVGSPEFLDVYAFPAANADQPYAISATFEEPTAALDHACHSLGADGLHFVNAGVVQDEYRDHLHGAAQTRSQEPSER